MADALVCTYPWLVGYGADAEASGLVVERLTDLARFELSHEALLVGLILASVPIAPTSLAQELAEELRIEADEAREVVATLQKNGLIAPVSMIDEVLQKEFRRWKDRGWEDAFRYSLAIRDYPFLDYQREDAREVDNGLMEQYAEKSIPPSIYLDIPADVIVPLPTNWIPPKAVPLHTVFRESLPDIKPQKVDASVEDLSSLLALTLGATGHVDLEGQGTFLLKTSPSGGARHPIEAYVLPLASPHLPRRVFHYSVRSHELHGLNSFTLKEANDALYEISSVPFKVRFAILYTGRLERSMWRYREPRSYRVVLHDLGHILETTKLVSGALELKTYFGHGFSEELASRYFGVGSPMEPLLKVAFLG